MVRNLRLEPIRSRSRVHPALLCILLTFRSVLVTIPSPELSLSRRTQAVRPPSASSWLLLFPTAERSTQRVTRAHWPVQCARFLPAIRSRSLLQVRRTSRATINIPNDATPGAYPVNINTQDIGGAPSHSTTVSLTVLQDFLLTSSTPSQTITDGQTTGPYNLTIKPVGSSFTGAVSLACPSGLPAQAVCIFSPSTPVTPGNSAVDVVMSISTKATRAGLVAPSRRLSILYAMWVLSGIVIGCGAGSTRLRKSKLQRCTITALLLPLILCVVSCAGASNGGGGGGGGGGSGRKSGDLPGDGDRYVSGDRERPAPQRGRHSRRRLGGRTPSVQPGLRISARNAARMIDSRFYVIIIGGGAVGLGVALEITRRFPRQRLLVLEKEDRVARHQSGHNSGVIHSGIYYKPGSLKARLCVAGAAAMVEFCREHGVPHSVCGKVIVATRGDELPRLEELRQRGEANGLTGLRLIGPEELREIEPHATGLQALVVPSTGVTDYALVCEKYAELITAGGGTVLTSAGASAIKRSATEIIVETSKGAFSTSALINCAGLYSDRISRMAGDEPGVRIIPFRGEYYDLVPERASLVRALIYPVPDPRFPFLGVHFTRRISAKWTPGPTPFSPWRAKATGIRTSTCETWRRHWRFPDSGGWPGSTGAMLSVNGIGRYRSQPSSAPCRVCCRK